MAALIHKDIDPFEAALSDLITARDVNRLADEAHKAAVWIENGARVAAGRETSLNNATSMLVQLAALAQTQQEEIKQLRTGRVATPASTEREG
jgi:hypothetical protein